MKNRSLVFPAMLIGLISFAQETRFYNDPDAKFKEAKEYFQKEQYSLAYPILKELNESLRETNKANDPIISQEISYYTIACGLKQNEGRAEDLAKTYIDVEKNNARVQQMSFHLGEYYYRKQDFGRAAQLYEQSNIANLSNAEIAEMKFHQGYSYFTLQRFAQAKPLFNSVRQMKDDANYVDANYYYGFLAFRDRNYVDALQSFKIVENEPAYAAVVPYYVAQIYYIQDKKEEALKYAEQKIKTGKSQFYDVEMKQLIGHSYFEKKEYDKALPYLEAYIAKAPKVSREEMYEVSYCYYQAKQYNKAIDGFKQLSGKQDSLSQHAMYLLGDTYLKTGQKSNARNAFLFCASNSSNSALKEVSRYNYAKLSYELGYEDEALNSLRSFQADYPNSAYTNEAKDLLAAVLTNTNNYKDALALMDKMPNPTANAKRLYPRILYGRATELINDGRLAEADALLDKALKDPNNTSVLPFISFWKGEIAYRNNNLDDAIKFYNAYVSAGAPANGDANPANVKYNLGYCYLRKENYPAALTFFQQLYKTPALNSDALTQDAYIRAADCYYMTRDYAKAKTMYDNVIRLSWRSEDYATFQNAMVAGVRSSNEKITLLTTLTRKFPSSLLVDDANMEIANAYLADERYRESIPYLSNVIKDGSNDMKPQAYLKLAIAYYNSNNNSEALNNYKTVVQKYPNSPEAQDAIESIKTISIESGKTDDYADFMKKAGRPLTVDTEDSLAFVTAENQYQNGDVNAALNSFNNYLRKFADPAHFVEANFYRGEIYNSKKDWNNALTGYEEVAAEAPNKFAEKAVLQAARINFFELKNYAKAETYYSQLKGLTSSQENRLEAMRGLLRCQYQQMKWTDAVANAKELLNEKGSSADDKSLANMAIAKSYQVNGEYDLAIANYKTVVTVNKAALAAEARYEIANSWFAVNKLSDAEKAAFEVINKSGSYDFWVTKSYILLGDIYYKQKDYFNAKATYQSIVDNSINTELKTEAQTKLTKVINEEGKSGKVGG
jgi:tetratricopeptide (TPR) repeat protein